MKKGQPGYKTWLKNVGKPRTFNDPQELLEMAVDYFKDADKDLWKRQELIRGGDMAGKIAIIPTVTPYSWQGFEAWLFKKGVCTNLDKYRHDFQGQYTKYENVVRGIDKIMFDQKFKGATVGAFNPSIIARDLRLAEVSEITQTNTTDESSQADIDKRIEALIKKRKS